MPALKPHTKWLIIGVASVCAVFGGAYFHSIQTSIEYNKRCLADEIPAEKEQAEAWLYVFDSAMNEPDKLRKLYEKIKAQYPKIEYLYPFDHLTQSPSYRSQVNLTDTPSFQDLPSCYHNAVIDKALVAKKKNEKVRGALPVLELLASDVRIAEKIIKEFSNAEDNGYLLTKMALKYPELVDSVAPELEKRYSPGQLSDSRKGSTSGQIHRLWQDGILPKQDALKLYARIIQQHPDRPRAQWRAVTDLISLTIQYPSLMKDSLEVIKQWDSNLKSGVLNLLQLIKQGNYASIATMMTESLQGHEYYKYAAHQIVEQILIKDVNQLSTFTPFLKTLLQTPDHTSPRVAAKILNAMAAQHRNNWREIALILEPTYYKNLAQQMNIHHHEITPILCHMAEENHEIGAYILELFTNSTRIAEYEAGETEDLLECITKVLKGSQYEELTKQALNILKKPKTRSEGKAVIESAEFSRPAQELFAEYDTLDEHNQTQYIDKLLEQAIAAKQEKEILPFVYHAAQSVSPSVRRHLYRKLGYMMQLFPDTFDVFYPIFIKGLEDASAKVRSDMLAYSLYVMQMNPSRASEMNKVLVKAIQEDSAALTASVHKIRLLWIDWEEGEPYADITPTLYELAKHSGHIYATALLARELFRIPQTADLLKKLPENAFITSVLAIKRAAEEGKEDEIRSQAIQLYAANTHNSVKRVSQAKAVSYLLWDLRVEFPHLIPSITEHFVEQLQTETDFVYRVLWRLGLAESEVPKLIVNNWSLLAPEKRLYPGQLLGNIKENPHIASYSVHYMLSNAHSEADIKEPKELATALNNMTFFEFSDIAPILKGPYTDAKNYLFWGLVCRPGHMASIKLLPRYAEMQPIKNQGFYAAVVDKFNSISQSDDIYRRSQMKECNVATSWARPHDDPLPSQGELRKAYPTDYLVWEDSDE